MPQLVAPDAAFHESFLSSHREWDGANEDGAGIEGDEDLETAAGFEAFVASLLRQETTALRDGYVTCTYRWIVEDGRYLGSIALRHELNAFLLELGGHIGYGIRPSARRRGLASWALEQMLELAWDQGHDRILITCDDLNVGSAKTIEGSGGVLEDKREHGGAVTRRYWIDL
ncbi:MAG: GNAT family N-acetyltransferase [Galactobacter sp.]